MFLITTTGTLGTVTFNDLGERRLFHPVVDFDLELEYNIQTLTNSGSIQDAIDGGHITVTNGTSIITDLSKYFMSAYVYDRNIDNIVDNSNKLDGFSSSYYVNVSKVRANKIIIKSLSDLPTPIGNVITLEPNTTYDIEGTINIDSNQLVFSSNTNILGNSKHQDILVYTGTGSVFNSYDNDFNLQNIGIKTPNGSVFNVINIDKTLNCSTIFCDFGSVSSIGIIDGCNSFSLDTCSLQNFDDGITIGNNNEIGSFYIHNCIIQTSRNSGTGSVTVLTLNNGAFGDSLKITNNHIHSNNIGDIGINSLGQENFQLSSVNSNDFFLFEEMNSSPLIGIGVYSNNWLFSGNLGITNTTSESKTKIIRAFENLPTPVNGIITLANSYTYRIEGIVNVGTYSLYLGNNTVVNGVTAYRDGLTYTGTGSLFISENKSFALKSFRLSAPNGYGVDFKVTSGNEKLHSCIIKDMYYDHCEKLGRFENPRLLEIKNNIILPVSPTASGGFEFYGATCGNSFIYDNIISNTNGILLDLGTSIWDAFLIDRNSISVNDFGISGLTANQNLSTNGYGKISNNNFIGGGTYISNLDGTKWDYIANGGGISEKSDILSNSELYITSNATATTISTISTPVIIASSNFNTTILNRFTHNGSGILTYRGNSMINISMDATIYFTSGNNQNIIFYFAINNTPLIKTRGLSTTAGAGETAFSNPKGAVSLNNGDTISVYVENVTSNQNVTVTNMNWTIGI